MELKRMLGFVLMPVALLLAAWCTHAGRLWSTPANHTVPWLCCAVAIAVLLLGVTCVATGFPPAEVPLKSVVLVWLGTVIILGIGIVVDYFSYTTASDWLAAAGELVGFAVILAGTFWIPRMCSSHSAE